MHKEPIYLRAENSAIKPLSTPFNLGNLELKRGFLQEFIKDETQTFLEFKAYRNSKEHFYYIGFKISSNKQVLVEKVNPCPWDCPKDEQ